MSEVFKRLLAGGAAFAMMLAMTACGDKKEDKKADDDEETTVTTDATTTADEETTQTTAPTEEETEPTEEETTPTTSAPVEEEKTEPIPQYLVDVAALTALEATQDCAVSISNIEVVEDANMLVGAYGNDELRISVSNSSDDTVTRVHFYVAAYDENNALLSVRKAVELFDEEVMVFYVDELEMKNGDEETFALECRADRFAGFNMIISEYTTADGTVVKNSIAEEWLETALILNPEY